MDGLTILNTVITAFLAVVGACAGSFINFAVLRRAEGMSYGAGRSQCPECGRTLMWFDFIPAKSRTKPASCHKCKTSISTRYILVVGICALASPLCFVAYGLTWNTLLSLGVAGILLVVALIDLSTTEIPNILVIALIPFAAAAIWTQPEITLLSRGIGAFTVSLPMFLLALAINGAFGGGDIKLMVVCGFLIGWQNTLLAFFIALLLGGSRAIYLMASGRGKRGEHIVFGPALCTGIMIALLFGDWLQRLYLELF